MSVSNKNFRKIDIQGYFSSSFYFVIREIFFPRGDTLTGIFREFTSAKPAIMNYLGDHFVMTFERIV